MTPLPAVMTVDGVAVTRSQVLAFLHLMPCRARDVEESLIGTFSSAVRVRVADRGLGLLKRHGLATFDRTTRCWRATGEST